MSLAVKKIVLWRKEVDNQVGVLAGTLEPLAKAGADLQILMGYRYPGNEAKAMIELYPVTGKKFAAAADQAGLSASSIPTLLVEGDNKPGLAYKIAQTMAEAGLNLTFLVAHVIGKRFAATIGFATEDDAKRATRLVRKATAPGKK